MALSAGEVRLTQQLNGGDINPGGYGEGWGSLAVAKAVAVLHSVRIAPEECRIGPTDPHSERVETRGQR